MDQRVEELLSWVDVCPVCGGKLGRIMYPKRIDEKYCLKLCGFFTVIAGYLVFKISDQAE